MMRFAVRVSLLVLIASFFVSSLYGQTPILTINSFDINNLDARDCQGGYTAVGGSALCVTDLEGDCVSCGGSNSNGANNSSYEITVDLPEIEEYCSLFVTMFASGTSSQGPFEGAGQCGEDRIRLRISSDGQTDVANAFPTSTSWFSNPPITAFLPISGSSLNIEIEIGTQRPTEQLCVEQIIISGVGQGISATPQNDQILACEGEDVTLGLSNTKPGETYTWSGPNVSGANGDELDLDDIQESDEGAYVVEVTNADGCVKVIPFAVIVEQGGTGNISVSDVIECAGQFGVLVANTSSPDLEGDFEYIWTDPDGNETSITGSNTFNLGVLDENTLQGGYVVSVIDPNAPCPPKDPEVGIVVVLDGPGNMQTGNQQFCVDDPISLQVSVDGNDSYEYTWINAKTNQEVLSGVDEDGLGLPPQDESNLDDPDVYIVTAFDPNTGCFSDPVSYPVVVLDGPGQIQGDDAPRACKGSTIDLVARPTNPGNYQFNWTFPDGSTESFTGEDGTISIDIPENTNEQVLPHFLFVIDPTTGCTREFPVVVIIFDDPELPVVDADPNAPCGTIPNLSASVSGPDAPTIFWYDAIDSDDMSGVVGQGTNFSPPTPGTYYAATFRGICYSERVPISAVGSGELEASISPNQTICEGETANLSASGGTNYLWSSGQTDANISVTESGTYFVSVSDDDGCEAVESVEVIVNTVSELSVSDPIVSVCEGEPIPPLSVNANLAANEEIRWYNNAGTVIVSGTNTSISQTTAGSYFAEIRNTVTGCTSARVPLVLAINQIPEPEILAQDNVAGVCEGTSVNLVAADLRDLSNVIFRWTGDINQTGQSINVGAGTYTLVATTNANCSESTDITINQFTAPEASILGDDAVCPNGTTTLVASGGSTYQWSGDSNATSSEITVGAGTYTVVATDANGCQDSETLTITQEAAPSISSTEGDCAEDRTSYSVAVTTSGNNLVVNGNIGTVSGGNGAYTISNIPTGESIIATAVSATGCTAPTIIPAPICECPNIPAPQANASVVVCADETNIPALSVANITDANQEIRWYNSPSGGSPIDFGPTTSQSVAGTYYAEIVDVVSNCPSPRTPVELVINALPIANIQGTTEVCAGTQTALTASINTGDIDNIAWSSGQSSVTINVGAGTYTVTITNTNGCQDTETFTITSFPEPQASITGDDAVCPNSTTTLVASGGSTYQWSGDSNSTSSEITVGAGTYTVVATDANGCQDSETITVTQEEAPSISAASGDCADDLNTYSVVVTTSGSNLVVNGNIGTVSGGNGSYTISNIPAGEGIIATAVSATGCVTPLPIDAPECECPSISAPQSLGNQAICAGEAFEAISVSGVGVNSESQVQWFTTPTGGTAIATGLTFTPSAAGRYYARIVNTTNACESPATEILVEVNDLPVATISGAQMICAGETTILEANLTNGTPIAFQWSENANDAVSRSVIVEAGTYSVSITDENNCQGVQNITLTEFEPVQPVISGELSFCAGEETTLSVSGGVAYNWSNFATSEQVVIRNAGTYTVTATDTNGCEGTSSVRVEENSLPSLALNGIAECSGDLQTYSIRLTTALENEISTDVGTISGANGAFTISAIPSETPVVVRVVDMTTMCENSEIFFAPDCECPQIAAPQAMATTEICEGDDIPTLSVSNAGVNEDSEIRWYSDQTTDVVLETGATFTPTQAASATYYAEIYNILTNCTSARTAVNLTVNPTPIGNIAGDENTCPAEFVDLTASLTSGTATSFQWSSSALDATTSSVQVGPGIYTVTITDENGCITTPTRVITEYSVVPASISGELRVCPDETTELTAAGGVGSTFEWNNFAQSNRVSVGAGDYSVTVTDANGCQSFAFIEVVEDAPPSLTLNSLIECSEDLETYGFQIITAATNIVTTSIGQVSGENSVFSILGVTKDFPVIINLQDPLTGCESTQTFQSPDCECDAIAAPTAASTNTIALCAGDEFPALSVDATNVDTDSEIRWYNVASGGTQIAIGTNYTPDAAGTYYAEIFNTLNNCSSPRTAFDVVINDLPIANIAGPSQVCEGETVNLDAGNASSYTWNTGETTQNINVGAGTYSLTITDTNGCEASDEKTISAFEPTEISITGDLEICPEETTELTASGGESYTWNTGETSASISVGAGTYTVTAMDANGCESTQTQSVISNLAPNFTLSTALDCSDDLETYSLGITTEAGNELTASPGVVSGGENGVFSITEVTKDVPVIITITNPVTGCSTSQTFDAVDCNCESIAAPITNSDIAICEGDNFPTLTASSADLSESVIIRWYDADINGTALLDGVNFTPSAAGTYYAEVIDLNTGCTSARTPVMVLVNNAPVASINGENQLCPDSETTLIANEAESYLWSTGENTQEVTVSAGEYSLTITDTNECEGETNIIVEEIVPEQVQIFGSDLLCAGGTTTLNASTGVSFLWSDGTTGETIEAGVGTYSLTVTDANGCTSEANFQIFESDAPIITIANAAECIGTGETYSISINVISVDGVILANGVEVQGNGSLFFIDNIPENTPLEIVAVHPITNCETRQIFDAPNCECPTFIPPAPNTNQTICADDEIPTFTASSPDQSETREIRWYDVDIDGEAIATGEAFTPSEAGTYFVELFDTETGCTSSREAVSLTINANPVASIVGDEAYCEGESVTLTASGGDSFLWSTGEQSESIEVQAGTYSVEVSNANGCTDETRFEVVENALPSLTLASAAACAQDGNTYTLELTTEAGNILIVNGETLSSATGIFSVADIDVEANAAVIVRNPITGCEDMREFAAPNCECPQFAAPISSPDQNICEGDEIEAFTATSPDQNETREIRWYEVEVDGEAIAIGASFTPSEAGTYFVELFDTASGCTSARTALTLSINPNPVVEIVGEASICEDETATLIANGASEYTWSTGETSSSIEVNASNQYSVVGLDANGCEASAAFELTVSENPVVTTDAPNAVCEDETVEVTASGADNYVWSNNQLGATVTLSAGTYTITATNTAGCSSEAEVLIEQGQASEPTLIEQVSCDEEDVGEQTLILTNASGCDSLVIIATSLADNCNIEVSLIPNEPACADDGSGSVTINIENGTPPYNYTWMTLDDRSGEGISEEAGFLVEGLSGGEYEFVITDAAGQQQFFNFEFFEPSAIEIDFTSENASCFGLSDGRVEASVSGGTGDYTYEWNTNDTDALLLNLRAGEYTLAITDENGCTEERTAIIEEPAAITITANGDAAACEEAEDGSITISNIQNVDFPVEYSINGINFEAIDNLPFQIDGLAFGDYTLFVQDMNDCQASTEVNVAAAESAFAEIQVSAETIAAGEEVQLTVETNLIPSKITWRVSTSDSLSCDDCLTPTTQPRIGTQYYVEVTDENGCSATALAFVFVEQKDIVFANAFSPNGDGVNDIFYIWGNESIASVNYLLIYDRWGDLVFSLNEAFPPDDTRFGWDGFVRSNEPAAAAIYTFIVEIEFEDGTTEVRGGDLLLER